MVYAIWCGVGIAVVATVGVLLFGESLSPLRIAGLLAIMIGTILLSLSGKGH
ncbi:multidrug efflux system protein MdtJ [compost metagenome]